MNDLIFAFEKISTLISDSHAPVLIISHSQADPDSLASAILFRFLMQEMTNNSIHFFITLPKISKLTERIIQQLRLDEFLSSPSNLPSHNIQDYILVLVDSNQPKITDLSTIFDKQDNITLWNLCKFKFIIDHHIVEDKSIPVDVMIVNDNYCSSTEILVEMLLQRNLIKAENKQILSIALLGILFDSKRLRLANNQTLHKVAKILSILETKIDDHIKYLDYIKDYSERIALLKVAQRNKLISLNYKNQVKLISLSFVSSFESSCARSLLQLGSDFSAVLNMSNSEIRISFRSTNSFYEDTGVHCGELAKEMALSFSGTGSGHPTASGCNLTITTDKKSKAKVKSEIFDSIIKYLKKCFQQERV